MIVLQGISLILDLPANISNLTPNSYIVSLFFVWKRTLPVALGSIIIKDWT
jgi:hypothetical protein